MSDKKPTDWQGIVNCPTLEIKKKVVALAVECGWGNLPLGSFDGYDMVGFGWCGKGEPDLVHGHGIQEHRVMKPTFPVLHGETDWDQLVSILRGEPEFDESPLPYDMDKELQEQTRAKFNLSPEQWLEMPLMVKEALAGCEIKAAQFNVEWRPVSEPPGNDHTIIFTCQPNVDINSANAHNAIGFFSGGTEVHIVHGNMNPRRATHWCYMPGDGPQQDEE